MSVQRWDAYDGEKRDDGHWVEYADYAVLEARLAEAEARNAGLTSTCAYLQGSYDSYVAACERAEAALARVRGCQRYYYGTDDVWYPLDTAEAMLASDVLAASETGAGDGGC